MGVSRPLVEKKVGVKRQKKMSSALLNLSRSVQELTEENQSLKEDLDRVLSNSPTITRVKGIFPRKTAGRPRVAAPGQSWAGSLSQCSGCVSHPPFPAPTNP